MFWFSVANVLFAAAVIAIVYFVLIIMDSPMLALGVSVLMLVGSVVAMLLMGGYSAGTGGPGYTGTLGQVIEATDIIGILAFCMGTAAVVSLAATAVTGTVAIKDR